MFPVTYIAGETVILQGKIIFSVYIEKKWIQITCDANRIVIFTQVMKVTISMLSTKGRWM